MTTNCIKILWADDVTTTREAFLTFDQVREHFGLGGTPDNLVLRRVRQIASRNDLRRAALDLGHPKEVAWTSPNTVKLEITEAQVESFPYPANPVSVYTALRDVPGSHISAHIGVFSSEELARTACQEDADDDHSGRLTWIRDDWSESLPDGTRYAVVMTTLDVPTGQG